MRESLYDTLYAKMNYVNKCVLSTEGENYFFRYFGIIDKKTKWFSVCKIFAERKTKAEFGIVAVSLVEIVVAHKNIINFGWCRLHFITKQYY